MLHQEFACRWPLWKPDASGFYCVVGQARAANLCAYDFGAKTTKQLTSFKEDAVVFPAIARDGSKIVFRHLFDLYCYEPFGEARSRKLDLYHSVDRAVKKTESRVLTTASAAAFTPDGLEIAFVAGGDLWVMDTELREPRQITKTAAEEAEPLFTPDGQSILFVRQVENGFSILKATRKDPKQYWWQNRDCDVAAGIEIMWRPSKLKLSPDGKKLAYNNSRGELRIVDLGALWEEVVTIPTWDGPDFDWSPDGKWLVLAKQDADFNRDIWLLQADGKGKPFNVSRHPFSEFNPVWSPDGKMLAFASRRASGESGSNVCLVWLNPEDDEKTARDRKLEKAASTK